MVVWFNLRMISSLLVHKMQQLGPGKNHFIDSDCLGERVVRSPKKQDRWQADPSQMLGQPSMVMAMDLRVDQQFISVVLPTHPPP